MLTQIFIVDILNVNIYIDESVSLAKFLDFNLDFVNLDFYCRYFECKHIYIDESVTLAKFRRGRLHRFTGNWVIDSNFQLGRTTSNTSNTTSGHRAKTRLAFQFTMYILFRMQNDQPVCCPQLKGLNICFKCYTSITRCDIKLEPFIEVLDWYTWEQAPINLMSLKLDMWRLQTMSVCTLSVLTVQFTLDYIHNTSHHVHTASVGQRPRSDGTFQRASSL